MLTAEPMKETLASDRAIAGISLPADVAAGLAKTRAALKGRSLIVWGEHCSECAYPACYAHCAFYSPRADLNCRRFERGIESVAGAPGVVRIRFRKWGKLEGRGPAPVRPIAAADRLARTDATVEAALSAPLPYAVAATSPGAGTRGRPIRPAPARRCPPTPWWWRPGPWTA